MFAPILKTNFSMSKLINLNFRKIYDVGYGSTTTYSNLYALRSECTSKTIICAAGGKQNSDNLNLISCANCFDVLNETVSNKPKFCNGAYWYFTSGTSFGFAPNSIINQSSCDTTDYSDNLRLCWHLVSSSGWRLGNLTNLSSDTYRKYIFVN